MRLRFSCRPCMCEPCAVMCPQHPASSLAQLTAAFFSSAPCCAFAFAAAAAAAAAEGTRFLPRSSAFHARLYSLALHSRK